MMSIIQCPARRYKNHSNNRQFVCLGVMVKSENGSEWEVISQVTGRKCGNAWAYSTEVDLTTVLVR